MITREEAYARIIQHLSAAALEIEVVVLNEETLEYDWGWVFFYQSKEYVDTGEFSAQLAGNAPLIVNRISGDITCTGTARPVEEYIRDYELQLQSESHGAA